MLIELITAIRNIRAVWRIDQRSEVEVKINTADAKSEKIITDNQDIILRLAKAQSLEAGNIPKPHGSALEVVRDLEVYVPLSGLIDLVKEKERLERDLSKLEREEKSLRERLKNKEFLSKAPEDVVENQKARSLELLDQMKKLKGNLNEAR